MLRFWLVFLFCFTKRRMLVSASMKNYLSSLVALGFVWASASLWAVPAEISEVSFLKTRQEYGETRKDKSVDNNPLKIAGTVYATGIGTHATSMIPLDVPEKSSGDARNYVFTGTVGIDDEVTAGIGDGVECRILSGSDVLWRSGKMMRGEAKQFSVRVPAGSRKLYLLSLAGQNNWNDHVDWVNLGFEAETPVAESVPAQPAVFRGEDYGLVPGEEDATPALRKLLNALRERGASGRVVLPKGDYHFYNRSALEMTFHVSNHDQPAIHPVQIPLVDLKNVEIDGNGSTFIFHGKGMALLIMDAENVKLKNLRLDYARSPYSEAKVLAFESGKTVVSIDGNAFPYAIENGHLRFRGEGWISGVHSVIAFRKGTKEIVEGTSDIGFGGRAEKRPDGNLNLLCDFSKIGSGVGIGDTLTLRTWARPHPACVIYRANGTTFENVSIHSGWGMALLAQRSNDISIVGGGVFPRPETGRVYSASADAFHFSNVGGHVSVTDAFFETMMDDAINVHSTCLSVEAIPEPNRILCRYKHPQAVGFEIFLPGETLRFIKGPTLEESTEIKVKSVRKLSTTEILVTLDGNVPAGVKPGDAVENADFQPSVDFCRNTVQNNRARGALFTTPRRISVRGNTFKNVAGAAILLAGDAQGWYESGACRDIEIVENRFINNLTSRFQFTEAIISIYPEVKSLISQKNAYHRNVTIRDNAFETFNVPLLFAISTDGLDFSANTIRYNNDYKAWNAKPFIFRKCRNVRIENNRVAPAGTKKLEAQTWSLNDCKLDRTLPEAVKISR